MKPPVSKKIKDCDQVRALASRGFGNGCHTHTHVDLGTADEQTDRAELELSKRKLHEQLGKPRTLFAYSFGGRDNISERSPALVRKAGFVAFDLNRIPVGQRFVTPAQFAPDLFLNRI